MNNGDTRQVDSLQLLLRQCCDDFVKHHGVQPDWAVAAPGRVNLIGEHTDYNDGFVLPMAIERYVVMAGRRAPRTTQERLRITSTTLGATVDIPYSVRPTPGEPHWANYPRGVVAGFLDRGHVLPSIDCLLASNVPLGGGLSSSAAFEVATATLLETASGIELELHEKARLCQKAEHDFAGVPCGIMDQLISVLGDRNGALLIDCRTETARVVPLVDRSVSFLVTNTNVRHSLASGEYGIRRTQCRTAARKLGLNSLRDATLELLESRAGELTDVEVRRARHVITENRRTLLAADALIDGDLKNFGKLMAQSHASLRDDFEVSCRELDVLVDTALALGAGRGVLGARMTGGGFGGCTVTLVTTERVEEVMTRLDSDYQRLVGGAITGFVSRPAQNAHRMILPVTND